MHPTDNDKQRSRPGHTGQDLRKPLVRKQDFSCYHACFPQYSSKVKSYKKAAELPLTATDSSSMPKQLPPSGFLLQGIACRSSQLCDKTAASLRPRRGASSPTYSAAHASHRLPHKLATFLQRRASALTRTDTNNFLNRRNKDLAIAHVAGAARFDNHVNQALRLIVIHHELA